MIRYEEVQARAREIWEQREEEMWGGSHFARQTWEQGTDLAKKITEMQAYGQLVAESQLAGYLGTMA
jgi:hypothetical protein